MSNSLNKRNSSEPWQHPRFKVGKMVSMPYTQNPYLPKLRAQAVNLVRQGRWSMRKVARHIGVQPSTVSRWIKRSSWMRSISIPTQSSRPHTNPSAIDEKIVNRIIELRKKRKRCADVIHAQLKREGFNVCISTVYRTLKRNSLINEKSPHKKYHLSGIRPRPDKPGILMETDTIHIYLGEKRRIYILTLIDCYSRWAYARASHTLNSRLAVEFVKEAQQKAKFNFLCIQSDHGAEYSKYFSIFVEAKGLRHRHCRIRKPNDNAHIERFNRTIQEEMEEDIFKYKTNIPLLNEKIEQYLEYYNQQRLHMGIDFQTPYEVLQRS